MSERDRRRDDLVRAARDTSTAVDTAALETALTAYREAAAVAPVEAPAAAPVTRRHRVFRAVAATTLVTKILVGVATAAAVGGIGVAVTETVHHRAPAPPPTVRPSTPPAPSSTSAPPSSTASPTASPTMTVTDTASIGAGTPTPSGSRTPTGSPSRTGSSTRSPSSSPTRSAPTPTDRVTGSPATSRPTR